jgi:hypothetical protein
VRALRWGNQRIVGLTVLGAQRILDNEGELRSQRLRTSRRRWPLSSRIRYVAAESRCLCGGPFKSTFDPGAMLRDSRVKEKLLTPNPIEFLLEVLVPADG